MLSKSWVAVSLAVSLVFGVSGCGDSGKAARKIGQHIKWDRAATKAISQDLKHEAAVFKTDSNEMGDIVCFLAGLVEIGNDIYKEIRVQELQNRYGVSEDQARNILSDTNSKGHLFNLVVKVLNDAICG